VGDGIPPPAWSRAASVTKATFHPDALAIVVSVELRRKSLECSRCVVSVLRVHSPRSPGDMEFAVAGGGYFFAMPRSIALSSGRIVNRRLWGVVERRGRAPAMQAPGIIRQFETTGL